MFKCPCIRQAFRLPIGNAAQGLVHITQRHGPGVIPVGNSKLRGVWTEESWGPKYINEIFQRTLCWSISKNPTENNITSYTAPWTIQDFSKGVPVGRPRPIGFLYGPNGSCPVPTSWVTVVVNNATGTIITAYPSGPPPSQ